MNHVLEYVLPSVGRMEETKRGRGKKTEQWVPRAVKGHMGILGLMQLLCQLCIYLSTFLESYVENSGFYIV